MKTTIHVADALLDAVQRIARDEATTLDALVAEGLREVIRRRSSPNQFRLVDASVGGEGLSPEFEGSGWPQFRAAIYPEADS